MKNMKRSMVIISALAIMIAGCGKGTYTTPAPATVVTPAATSPAVDPISNFNTKWASEDQNPALDSTHLRTLANFLGYDTAHYANIPSGYTPGCIYGYHGAALSGGCIGSGDVLRNYFAAAAPYLLVYPAPMDLGSVTYYKIRFAANVEDSTRKMIPGDAYLDINVISAAESFTIKYATVKSALTVVEVACTGGNLPPCEKINVTFGDDCGDIALSADRINGSLLNPIVTFTNTVASYKNKGCYFSRSLPDNALTVNNAIPSKLPKGIHSNGAKGELFKDADLYSGIPTFIEQ
ncbi:MAG: hypothetical protein WCQ53_01310 [bacterium]